MHASESGGWKASYADLLPSKLVRFVSGGGISQCISGGITLPSRQVDGARRLSQLPSLSGSAKAVGEEAFRRDCSKRMSSSRQEARGRRCSVSAISRPERQTRGDRSLPAFAVLPAPQSKDEQSGTDLPPVVTPHSRPLSSVATSHRDSSCSRVSRRSSVTC